MSVGRAEFFLIVLLVCQFEKAAPAQSTPTPDSLPRHAVVFAHHADATRKNYDIWQIAADGTQMASVVVQPNHQDVFTISPDGNELIYVDLVDGKRDLFRRRFTGGIPVNLTNSSANDSGPAWSPDGRRLLFGSDRDGAKRNLYLMALESGELTRLTENELHDSDPSWAPDGTKFIFTRFIPGDEDTKSAGHGAIFEYDFMSGTERQISDLGGYCGGVDYSPDGQQIAFHRVADGGSELWIMQSDGSDPRPLSKTFIDEYSPAWSPDGNWIVYTAGTGNDSRGTFDLWLMRADSSERRLISAAPNTQMSPRWRPGDHFIR